MKGYVRKQVTKKAQEKKCTSGKKNEKCKELELGSKRKYKMNAEY